MNKKCNNAMDDLVITIFNGFRETPQYAELYNVKRQLIEKFKSDDELKAIKHIELLITTKSTLDVINAFWQGYMAGKLIKQIELCPLSYQELSLAVSEQFLYEQSEYKEIVDSLKMHRNALRDLKDEDDFSTELLLENYSDLVYESVRYAYVYGFASGVSTSKTDITNRDTSALTMTD